MIAWLLDPQEWHGLGDKFSSRFVQALLGKCHDVDPSVQVVRVHTEYSTGEGPIDILLETQSGQTLGAIGIENKVDSPEGDGQLHRYAEALKQRFQSVGVALLTPEGLDASPKPKCPYAPINYADVAPCLEGALQSVDVEHSMESVGLDLARQYLDVVRGDVMREANSEVKGICGALYEQYRDAWQVIRRQLPSEEDELLRCLGSAVCERFERAFSGAWRFSILRGKYARVYRPNWRVLGEKSEPDPIIGWKDKEGFLDWDYAATHLRLYITAVPDEESANGYAYRISCKFDRRSHTRRDDLPQRIVDALKAAGLAVPDQDQSTVYFGSKSKLPSIARKPDAILGWIAGRAEPVVKALDSGFGTERRRSV
jgi:hypothetical protein